MPIHSTTSANNLAFLEGGGAMGERMRAHDWASTPLGHAAEWPQSLKTAVSILLGCRSPLSIWWGPQLIHLCNDACVTLLGDAHADSPGRRAREVWSEAWPVLGARAEAVLREGHAHHEQELPLLLNRSGQPEEVYLTFSYGPIRDADGQVAGLFCACTDETQRVLGRRRLRTLSALAEHTAQARTPEAACATAAATLADDAPDVPFSLFYLLDESAGVAHLAGASGVTRGAQECPEQIDLESVDNPWPLVRVIATRRAELVERLPGTFAPAAGAPLAVAPQRALVLPLRKAGQDTVVGFLIVGIGARRPLDDDYRDFFALIAGQMASAFANARGQEPRDESADALVDLDRAKTGFFSSASHEARSPLTLVLRRMLNVDGVAVLLFEEATGTLLDANDFFFHMSGYTRGEVAAGALSWRTMTPPEHVAISEAQMARLSATGHIGPYEKEYLRKDGTRSWMVFAGASLGNGIVVEYCIDVSDRKRAEAALRASEDALRASEARLQLASKAKDDFLGTLGHELRTPLAAITLWARVIRSGAVAPSELNRALDLIIESAATQTRLVDDLLDLSRLASGKLVLTPVDVLVEEAARSAVELLRPAAEAKGVRLALDVTPNLGRAVIDVARLRQVLWNLVSNSIKFTPPGGAVTLKLGKSQGALEVEVSDTGEGIAPEFMPHLFERFSQADISLTRPRSGLGIGLALCRHLVELQGGTIEAHSDGLGRGATFRVRLPWVDAEPVPAERLSTTTRAEREQGLTGVTVLLVEDDEYTLAGMRVTLERAGARVIALDSAVAALATFEALDPSTTPLLVSDMIMPTMSGYELIEQIAKVQRARGLPSIPACAVSGHARDDDRARAVAAGFDLYLVKPVTPEHLVEAVIDLAHIATRTVP